jgi:outer membrane protein TolC
MKPMNPSAKPSRTNSSRTKTSLTKTWRTGTEGRTLRAAIVGVLGLTLPACGIPDLRKPDPGPAIKPDPAAEAAGSSAGLSIEEFFGDPKLTSLIATALAGNQEQKIMAEDVQIAAKQILGRRGAYLPLVSMGARAAMDKASKYTLEGAGIRDDPYQPGQFFTNPHGDHGLGLNLTWQIDIWRQLRNARDAAIQRFLSSNEARNYYITRLVAEIADNYYQLLALDQRMQILDQIIALQEQSLRVAETRKEFGRDTELGVQRFLAEVRKNQSQKLIVRQDIIEVENRINFLVGRFPQPVDRWTGDFINLDLHPISAGVPAQLLQNRPDIRQAERELAATGLDVRVAKMNFFPKVFINSGVGYAAFNARYLLVTPEALIYNVAGDLVAPLVNKRAIQAEYLDANARQLQAVYNYQKTVLEAVTEVINRLAKVDNYGRSVGDQEAAASGPGALGPDRQPALPERPPGLRLRGRPLRPA